MMEAMASEKTNPKLYGEIMKEFVDCFNLADANKNGILDEDEFKTFM
jgi:Ca2+-binding EF-hand superfamily protein